MKRSEMLDLLENWFFSEFGEAKGGDAKISANRMLDFIEKLGMKPPCLDNDRCQAIMQIYYGGYTFNQWDEDFEKDEEVVKAYRKRLERKNV